MSSFHVKNCYVTIIFYNRWPELQRKGTMSQKKWTNILFLLLILFSTITSVNANTVKIINFSNLPYKKSTKKKILSEEPFVNSEVKSFEKKMQSLNISMAGMHKKKCIPALRKISLYENYQDFLTFIEKSSYDEKKERIILLISSSILPMKMVLDFKLPRIKKPGVYHFKFDKGFLKGLLGEIHVSRHNERCLFFVKGDWIGPDTGFPNLLLELFSSTLTKLGMEKLFRI